MNKAEIKKEDYLISLDKQLGTFNKECDSIKTKIESKELPNEAEVQKKNRKLKESMKRFTWKIHHLKESDIEIDDLVKESCKDIIDEITLQIEDIELAMQGKHLWDIRNDFDRDKWKIKDIQN